MSELHPAAGCVDCAVLPATPSPAGELVVAPPLAFSLQALGAALLAGGFQPRVAIPSTLTIPYREGQLPLLATIFEETLSTPERADARGLCLGPGEQPGLDALLRMEPLQRLIDRVRAGWLIDLLREERATTHFQPIFTAAGELFACECLLRGLERDGHTIISPAVLYHAAVAGDLLFHLDRFARLLAIRNGAALGTRLFINFTPTAIYNPAFCLRSTVEAVHAVGLPPSMVIFEVVESHRVEDVAHLVRILETYRAAGFAVALDDFGQGAATLALLDRVRPDYVKLDMELIRGIDHDPYRATIATRTIAMARDLGIRTLAEGIETEGELRAVREAGVDLVQGFLLGRPSARPHLPGIRQAAA